MKKTSSKSGFTLVELLVVVAIIGVLATIGIPTFKGMVEKARKSEAKVWLGTIYTVEASFQNEFSTFTNNLFAAGLDIADEQIDSGNDIARHPGRYNFGFNGGAANCQVINQAPYPGPADPYHANVLEQNPNFMTDTVSVWLFESGAANLAYDCCSKSLVTSNAFKVFASGIIRPGVEKAWLATCEDGDHWMINEKRELADFGNTPQ